jgi:hypothetical protein
MRSKALLSVCVAFFGALLVWPLLSIANRPVLVAGLPVLVLYLFAIWAAIVAVLLMTARRAGGDPP